MENDFAKGIEKTWRTEIELPEKRGDVRWDSQKIIEFFSENVFQDNWPVWEYSGRLEILALAELLHKNGYSLGGSFLDAIKAAIKLELSEKNLREWDSPDGRKKCLKGFARELSISLADLGKLEIRLPEFKPDSERTRHRIERWLDDKKFMMTDEEHPFLYTLDRIMRSGLGYDYGEEYLEATRERLMLMAFHIGHGTLSNEETKELVRKMSKATRL